MGPRNGDDEPVKPSELDGPLPLAVTFQRVAPQPGQALELFETLRVFDDVDALDVPSSNLHAIRPHADPVVFILAPELGRSEYNNQYPFLALQNPLPIR